MRLILVGLLQVCLCVFAGSAYAELPSPVLQALREQAVPVESVSVWAQRLDAPALAAIQHQADKAMNPASVMKLVTSYAALELLGPSYRWQTDVYATALPQSGVLAGDLWLRGSGDPNLNTANIYEIVSRLQQQYALKRIQGQLMLDASAFAAPANVNFDEQLYRSYNAPVSALMLNQQAVRLQFVPQGEQVRVVVYPRWPGLNLNYEIKLVDGACGDWKSLLQLQANAASFSVRGSYAKVCGEKFLDVTWLDSASYLSAMLHTAWQQQGGVWSGTQYQMGTVPAQANLLLSHVSPSLSQTLYEMNKSSNNVMAKALFLSLSRTETAAASAPNSVQRINSWLASKGLQFNELVLENGSGLSRNERISAAHLAALLQAAYASPVMPELLSSLPIYGVDGTLSRREGSAVYGRAHLKTGSLDDVRAFAGYVVDQQNRPWAVVFIANGNKAAATKSAQEALLEWVYKQN